MNTQDDTTYYISIDEDEVDSLLDCGIALHFYLWMIRHRYISKKAEEFGHVGAWVKRGLVVTTFLRKKYAELAGCSERTVTNYISRLEEVGRVKVVSTGKSENENLPMVIALGFWKTNRHGKRYATYDGWLDLLPEAGKSRPGGLPDKREIAAIRRDMNKTDRQEVAARKVLSGPPGTDFPDPLEKSCQLILTVPNLTDLPLRNYIPPLPSVVSGGGEETQTPPVRKLRRKKSDLVPAPVLPMGDGLDGGGSEGAVPETEPPLTRRVPPARPANPMFDALAPIVSGSTSPAAQKAAASHIAKVGKLLTAAEITPEEVPALTAYIQTRMVTKQSSLKSGTFEKYLSDYMGVRDGTATPTATSALAARYLAISAQAEETQREVEPKAKVASKELPEIEEALW